MRASISSEFSFSSCRLPASALLEGASGLRAPLACLNEARFGIVFGVLGAARASLEAALAYAARRELFGRRLSAFQLTQAKLAEMAATLGTATLLATHLGRLKEAGRLRPEQVSLGKLNNASAALSIAREDAHDPRRQWHHPRLRGDAPRRQPRERAHLRGHSRGPPPGGGAGAHRRTGLLLTFAPRRSGREGSAMELELSGRTALVSGASSGIGYGIALALGREGVRLAVTARRRDRLAQLRDEIVAAGGPEPVLIAADLSEETAPGAIALAALEALGSVAILVNNAGGSRPLSLTSGEQEWEEAMTLNFTRQRQLTLALVGQMIDARWGRIINITGKSEPEGLNGAFCAKAAMHAFAKGLSREVGRHGVTVNSIPPGRIMSEQIERNYTPEYRAWQSEHEIPVGEYGQPADVAALVCFLASPAAHYLTGAVIPVDGGLRRYQF